MMKQVFVIIALVCMTLVTYAQETAVTPVTVSESPAEPKKNEPHTYVSGSAFIDKYHNEVELEKMGKLELTDLYLERVRVLTEVIPYLALNKAPAGADLQQLGIPETKTNMSQLDREVRNKDAYLQAVNETMHDIVPYADKKNIIWCILFLEDTLHKVNKAAEADK